MTLEDVQNLLDVTGLPVAYRAFPEGHVPPLPFICYLTPGTNNFAADNCTYHVINSVNVELYTEYKDPITEAKVEDALASFFWEKNIEYIDSERCYQITYEIEV